MPHECTTCGRTFPDGSKEMLSGCPDCGGNKFQFAPAGRTSRSESSGAGSGSVTSTAADTDPDSETGTADPTGTVERAAETVRDWVSTNTGGTDPETGSSEPTASNTVGSDSTATDDGADRPRSWPSSDDGAVDDSEPGEFKEWPETARRPEDRSSGPSDGSSGTDGGSPSETASSADRSPADSEPDGTDRSRSSQTRATIAESENSAQADARSAVVSTDDLPTDGPERDRPGDASREECPEPSAASDDQPPDHGRVVSEPAGDRPSIEELRAELNEQFESIKILSPGQYELNLMELYDREEYIISLQEDGRYVIDVPDSWRSNDE